MKNLYLFLFFVLFSFFIKPINSYAQIDTRFWFAAPEITRGHGDRDIFMRFSTLDKPATIVVSMPKDPTFPVQVINLAAFSVQSINLTTWINRIETPRMVNTANPDNDANRNYTIKYPNGILVESTAKITAYYEVNVGNNPDIFPLKGKNGLGTDFWVPMQTAWNSEPKVPNPHSGFIIVATENGTVVTVKTTKATESLGAIGTYTINLDRGEAFNVSAHLPGVNGAPAGSHITSNKPIAVTLFHDTIKTGKDGCHDLAGDQLVPTSIVGKEYIVMRGTLGVGGTAQPEKVYILATQNNTVVNVNRNGTVMPSVTLAAGEQHGVDMDAGTHPRAYITSDKPVYVLHMSGYGCETGAAILPPIDCTGSRLSQFVRATNESFSLTLMVRTGGQADFKINNTVVPATVFTDVPGTGSAWKSARITDGEFATAGITIPNTGIIKVENSSTLFHVGVTNGGAGTGCRYGYFSSFNSLNLGPDIAIFYGSNVVLDATTFGAVGYLWSTGSIDPTITVDVRRTRDYIVRVDLGQCFVYDTICVGTIEYVWVGDTNDDFGNNANWSAPCGQDGVPTCERDIVIPALVNGLPPINFPVVKNIQGCRNIIIEDGATFTINSPNASNPTSKLNVCGDMVHSGKLIMKPNSQLEFIGLQPQSYTRTATGTGNFENLRINNQTPLSEVPRVKVSDAGTQNMVVSKTGSLTFIRGIVRTEGDKEVVVHNPASTSITGYSTANYADNNFIGGRLRRAINTTGSYDFPVGLAVENLGTATIVTSKTANIIGTNAGDWIANTEFCLLNPFTTNKVINLNENSSNSTNGNLRHIKIPDAVAFSMVGSGNNARTIEMWAKISSASSSGALFSVGTNDTKKLFALRRRGTTTGYSIDLGGGISQNFELSGTINRWNHFAVTYNGVSEINVYLNGTLVYTWNVSDLQTTSNNFFIGKYLQPISGTNRFWYAGGLYDNVRVWNKAKAQAEVFSNSCVRYDCVIPTDLIANYDMQDAFNVAYHKTRNCVVDPLLYERANVTFQTPMTDAKYLLTYFNQYTTTPSSPTEYRCGANFGSCPVLDHGFWTISAYSDSTLAPAANVTGNGKYRLTLYNNAYSASVAPCLNLKAAIMKRNTSANPWSIPAFPALCFNNSLDQTAMEWMTGFSDFGVPTTTDDVILPVELIELTAKPLISSILVEWKTVNEVDNAGFEILRSTDGINFKKVGWVTRNDAGVYSFEDFEVNPNQLYYYRLNQIDNNGTGKASPVVQAKTDRSVEGGIKVYPNPTRNEFTIDLNEMYVPNTTYQVEIYNSIGMILKTKMVTNSSKINMSLEGLAKGMYLVKVITPLRTTFVKLEKE